jgi:hypothetical protein
VGAIGATTRIAWSKQTKTLVRIEVCLSGARRATPEEQSTLPCHPMERSPIRLRSSGYPPVRFRCALSSVLSSSYSCVYSSHTNGETYQNSHIAKAEITTTTFPILRGKQDQGMTTVRINASCDKRNILKVVLIVTVLPSFPIEVCLQDSIQDKQDLRGFILVHHTHCS